MAKMKEQQIAMEERQKEMERTLQEADQWAKGVSETRDREEAQHKEEERKLNDQLAKAVQRAEDLQKEMQKAWEESAEKIRELMLNSERMTTKMNDMAAKILGHGNTEMAQAMVQVPVLTGIQAQNKPGPMELDTSEVPSLTPSAPSLTPIPTPWLPGTQEATP